jgi:hypothetical protein
MSLALGFFAVVSATLAIGGGFKVRDARPTAEMLRSLRLPGAGALAVTSGPVEVVLGLAGLLVAGRAVALAVALVFLGFTVMTARLVTTPGVASCGCFGRLSARPSALHVAVNGAMAAGAAAAAMVDVPALVPTALADDGGGMLVFAGLALATWLVVAVLTVLPDTLAAARRQPAAPAVREFALTPAGGSAGALDHDGGSLP